MTTSRATRPRRPDPARRSVQRQGVSIGVATGAYGLSFGALSVAAGLSVPQTCALSLLMFSGASQFAFVGILGPGGAPCAAIATAALLGARNGFYGLRTAQLVRPRGVLHRITAAHLTIDESTAVATAQTETHPHRPDLARLGFWAGGLSVFALWNLATALGALAGNALGDPARYGLDAAAAAAFLALLRPRLTAARPRAVAAGAAALAVACAPVLPAGVPVMVAATVAVLAGWPGPGRREEHP